MLTFRGVVLWIHLAAIIVWVGGMIVIPFVAAPALRRLASDGGASLVEALVRRFQRLSGELAFLVFLSGIFNVLSVGWLMDFAYPSGFLQTVGLKFGLFALMVANQVWYSVRLVPREEHRRAFWSAAANAVLAAVVVYLGLTLP